MNSFLKITRVQNFQPLQINTTNNVNLFIWFPLTSRKLHMSLKEQTFLR